MFYVLNSKEFNSMNKYVRFLKKVVNTSTTFEWFHVYYTWLRYNISVLIELFLFFSVFRNYVYTCFVMLKENYVVYRDDKQLKRVDNCYEVK